MSDDRIRLAWIAMGKMVLIMVVVIFTLFALIGCTTSYQHWSDPRIGNDGTDYICQGAEREFPSLRLSGSICTGPLIRRAAIERREWLMLEATYKWGAPN